MRRWLGGDKSHGDDFPGGMNDVPKKQQIKANARMAQSTASHKARKRSYNSDSFTTT